MKAKIKAKNLSHFIILSLFFSLSYLFTFCPCKNLHAMEKEEIEDDKSQKVTTGIYLLNITEFDVKSSIYALDFYLWFRWKGDIDPTESFEFINAVESWGMIKRQIYEKPEVMEDGSFYQSFHIAGKFNNKFDLSNYPFDEQQLTILIEDSHHPSKSLKFVVDLDSSKISPKISLPGWNLDTMELSSEDNTYATDFGRLSNELEESYSQVKFLVNISRPKLAYAYRLFLPIVLVLLSCFLLFFMSFDHHDVRVGIGLTAFLTIVALHITVSSDLPQVGYTRLIDKIYNLAYFSTFISILENVIVINYRDKGLKALAHKIDLWTMFLLPCFTIVGAWLIFARIY